MQFVFGFILLIIAIVVFSTIFFPIIPFLIVIVFLAKRRLDKENKSLMEVIKSVKKEDILDISLYIFWLIFKLFSAFFLWGMFTFALWFLLLKKFLGGPGLFISMILNLFWFYLVFKKEINWLRGIDEEKLKEMEIKQAVELDPLYKDEMFLEKTIKDVSNNPNIKGYIKEEIIYNLKEIFYFLDRLEQHEEKIPSITKYEIKKIMEKHLKEIISIALETPSEKNLKNLLEGLEIIKEELKEVYSIHIGNPEDKLEKEIEFLKRKYSK